MAELFRYPYFDLQKHIPLPLFTEAGKALVSQTQHSAWLGSGGNIHFRLFARQGRYFQFCPQYGIGQE